MRGNHCLPQLIGADTQLSQRVDEIKMVLKFHNTMLACETIMEQYKMVISPLQNKSGDKKARYVYKTKWLA